MQRPEFDDIKEFEEFPYIHAFDRLDEVHHQMEQGALTSAMRAVGFSLILQKSEKLPNGKALVRMDYQKVDNEHHFGCIFDLYTKPVSHPGYYDILVNRY